MSHDLVQKRMIVSVLPTPTGANGGPVDFNATGDKFIFTPAMPCDVYRWGIITIEAMVPDAGGFVISLERRPTVGSDTNRVVMDTLTRALAADVAAGKVIYREPVLPVAETSVAGLGGDNIIGNVGPAGPVLVNPGEELVIEVTNAVGAASTGYVWLEYVLQPFAGTRMANATGVSV